MEKGITSESTESMLKFLEDRYQHYKTEAEKLTASDPLTRGLWFIYTAKRDAYECARDLVQQNREI